MSDDEAPEPPLDAEHRGPPLMLLAVTFATLFITSIVGSIAMAGGEHLPSPFRGQRFYFVEHTDAVLLSAFLQFGAAIPLGLFTAVVVSRLRFLGLKAAGVHIALFGGFAASFMAAVSSLVLWAMSWPEIAAAPWVRTLHVLAFATGGPGHVVPFGLLVAGVSVSAGIAGLLPKGLTWFGLVVAGIAELSTLSLVMYPATFLIPIARWLGMAWMISVSAVLPRSRSSSRTAPNVYAAGEHHASAPAE